MKVDKLKTIKLESFETKAKAYIKDKKKASVLLNQALGKAKNHRGALGDAWDKFQLLFGVFRDWINGSYREMPTRSLLMIALAIVYFVSPVDAVLDYIPFAGLIDDATVAGFVISQISMDLDRYKQWKEGRASESDQDKHAISQHDS